MKIFFAALACLVLATVASATVVSTNPDAGPHGAYITICSDGGGCGSL